MKGQKTQNLYNHKRLNQMNDPALLFFIGSLVDVLKEHHNYEKVLIIFQKLFSADQLHKPEPL